MVPRMLFVLHQWYNRGGTEIHARTLAEKLAPQYDVTVVFPDENALVIVSRGQEIGRLPADPFSWPATPVNAPQTQRSLQHLLRTLQPDLVHVHHILRWPLGILEQLLGYTKRVLLSVHDYYYLSPDFTMRFVGEDEDLLGQEYSLRLFGGDISTYLCKRREYLRSILASLALILSPSRYVEKLMQKSFSGRYRLIEHGIEPFVVREKMPAPGRIRFGYLGAFIPQKGYDVLLRAYQDLRKRHSEVSLLMCGWGPNFSTKNYPEVSFIGPYNPSDVPWLLSHIDVGVIPSVFRETYSLVLSEFFHAEIPVIATRMGALTERVNAGENGVLVEPGDEFALAGALESFLDSSAWRRWQPQPPRLVSEMVAAYLQVYSEVLEG